MGKSERTEVGWAKIYNYLGVPDGMARSFAVQTTRRLHAARTNFIQPSHRIDTFNSLPGISITSL